MTAPFLTYPEAAARLHVSVRYLVERVRLGDLRPARFGRAVRFAEAELDRFAAERTAGPVAAGGRKRAARLPRVPSYV
jgi:excisionase family DNA binding protein